MFTILISALVFFTLVFARSGFSRNRMIHTPLMWFVVIFDTGLVLYLASIRNVLSKLEMRMSPILYAHIFMALAVLVGYFLTAYWGVKISKGNGNYRKHMRIADRIILPLRFLVLVTIILVKTS